MASEHKKLAKSFRRSWMSYEKCVEHLEQERLRRQNSLVLNAPDPTPSTNGWREDHGAVGFDSLVRVVRLCFTERRDARPEAVHTITMGCVLIAELLAAVFNEERRAGGVFHKSTDEQRHGKQAALYELRNAVCHPGYLPAPVNAVSHVNRFADLLNDERNPFKRELHHDRRHIAGAPVARWAVNATDELGRFEFGNSIVAQLERRGTSVSPQQRYRIVRRAMNRQLLPAMLKRLNDGGTAREIINAK